MDNASRLRTEKRKAIKNLQASEDYNYNSFTGDAYNSSYDDVFRHNKEDLLLEDLHQWDIYQKPKCSCRVYVLEYLHGLAFKFAKLVRDKSYVIMKNIKQLCVDWLYRFEIRHTECIAKHFSSEKKCKKDHHDVASQISDIQSNEESRYAKDETSSSTKVSQSLSLLTDAISEPNLPIPSSDSFKIPIRKTKNLIQRGIELYEREWSETQFKSNPKQEGNYPASQAQQGSDNDAFSIINVLKDIEDYKNEKLCVKLSFNQIISGEKNLIQITKGLAFKRISYKGLNKEFKKFQKSQDAYEYDRYTLCKAFKFGQQDSMLNKLIKWKEDTGCNCCICALVYFCRQLAYKLTRDECRVRFLEKNPDLWLLFHDPFKKNWVMEFYIRFRSELSSNFPEKKCWNFKSDLLCKGETLEDFRDNSNVTLTSVLQPLSSSHTEGEISLKLSTTQRKRLLTSSDISFDTEPGYARDESLSLSRLSSQTSLLLKKRSP